MRPSFRSHVTGRFSIRTTVAAAGAATVGAVAGVLTYLVSRSIPQAVLAAGAATGGSARFLGQILGNDRSEMDQDHHREDVEECLHQNKPPV